MNSEKAVISEATYANAPKRGGKRKKQIKKIILWAVIIAVIAIVLCFKMGWFDKAAGPAGGETVTTFTVMRRDIQNVLSGTGTLQPYDSYTVTALSSGEILEDFFEEGDEVTEDQILMKIDSSNLETSLERAQNSYDDAKEALDDLLETQQDLSVKSKWQGTIRVMDIEVGDEINANTVIASIVDMDTMLIDVPFMQIDTFSISKGDAAVLTVGDTLEELYGTVRKISPSYNVNENGVKTVNVTVEVSNPGAITESTSATAKIGEYSCTKGANFYYNVNETIKAETSGKVVKIVKGEGDRVNEGDIVLVLESESLEKSIDRAERTLKDALNSLEDAEDAFDNYEITAPISGTVIQKNYKKGEKIGSGSGGSGNTIAVIYDLSALKFDMNIDELDIDDLALGQEVNITSDAKAGRVYVGKITKISVQGTTSNGTTYYPITVTLEDFGKGTDKALRPGMNIDAEIVLEKVENALVVPVDAVGRGNRVKVVKSADNGQTEQNADNGEQQVGNRPGRMPEGMELPDGMELPEGMEIPEGIQIPEGAQPLDKNTGTENGKNTQRPTGGRMGGYSTAPKDVEYEEITVETGISDEEYVEIISGLKEGDVVISESAGISGGGWGVFGVSMSGGGMPGGMGAGMPGGMGGGMSGGMGGSRPSGR